MKISKVTITGADNNTYPADMQEISNQYPFVEWGILLSESKECQQRYPCREKIEQFEHLNVQLSGHLCGKYSERAIEGDTSLFEKYFRFKRFQINHSWKNEVVDISTLLWSFKEFQDRNFILQVNKANLPTIENLFGKKNILPYNMSFLYDESGGKGTSFTEFGTPFSHFTGYAGGISPDNIEQVCEGLVNRETKRWRGTWIDMESGVRTDNELDMDKVKRVLEIAKKYV